MAMDRRWKRTFVLRMSPVTTDMRRPHSSRKVSASALIGPKEFFGSDWYENMTNSQFAIFR